MDIVTGLQAVGQAISIVKVLRDIDKGIDVGELKAKLAEVYASLADAKMALTDATVEIADRDAEITRLIAASIKKAETVEVRGYAYDKKEGDQPTGWPFCPVCLTDDLRFYRLTAIDGKPRGACQCPKCKAVFSHVQHFA